jgi:tape measure domain-containing protein
MANGITVGITIKADTSGMAGQLASARTQLAGLGVAGSQGARVLIGAFAQSKRAAAGLSGDFVAATSAVAVAAEKLKSNAGDATLAREFVKLKAAAATAKEALVSNRVESEAARRVLAAQGVSVASLAADYRKLKFAQAAVNQLTSLPSSASSRMGTSGMSTAANSEQPKVHQAGNQLDDASVRIDRLSQKMGDMGHRATVFVAMQQYVLPYLATLGNLSDSYTKLNSQLLLATGASGSYVQAQADVQRIAASAATGIAETATLYARLSSSVMRLGFDQAHVAKVTETVGLALKVSGATATESSSAILQLSQAIGSGVLRGEEFNSVNEASPRLMQALADSIGKPREALRKMAEEGQLTSKLLVLALPQALDTLRQESSKMPLTIGQSFTLLNNEMTLMMGRLNSGTGVFSGFAQSVKLVADNLPVAFALAATAVLGWAVKIAQGVVATRAIQRAAHIAQLAEIAERTAAESVANQAALSGLARLGVARAAHVAEGVAGNTATIASNVAVGVSMRGLLLALTGPVGIVASIGLAAAAWIGFKSHAVNALDEAIAKQKELESAKAGTKLNVSGQDADVVELHKLESALSDKRVALQDLQARAAKEAKLGPVQGLTKMQFADHDQALKVALDDMVRSEAIIAAARNALNNKVADAVKAKKAISDELKNPTNTPSKKPSSDDSELRHLVVLTQQATAHIAILGAQSVATDKLTESEQARIKFIASLTATQNRAVLAERAVYLSKLDAAVVLEKEKAEREALLKLNRDGASAAAGELKSAQASRDALLAKVDVDGVLHANTLAATADELDRRAALMESNGALIKVTDTTGAAAQATIEMAANLRQAAKDKRETAAVLAQTGAAELLKQADAAEWERAKAGMTEAQIAALTEARYNERIALLAVRAASLDGVAGREAELLAVTAQIGAIGRLRDAQGAPARPAANLWAGMGDNLAQSLTDSLMRGFENGKSFAQNFIESVQNVFKSAVIELPIKSAMNSLMSGGGLSAMSEGGMIGLGISAAVIALNALAEHTQAQTAAEVQAAQSTGTVLGALSEKSSSVAASIDILNKTTFGTSAYLAQMNASLKSVDSAMRNFVAVAARALGGDIAANLGAANGDVTTRSGANQFGRSAALGLVGFTDIGKKLADALFGTTARNVSDSGLRINGTLGAISQGQGVSQYAAGTDTTSALFGLYKSSSAWEKTGGVSGDIGAAFGQIFIGIKDSISTSAAQLGVDAAGFDAQLSSFVINTGKLSLQGMSAAQQQEAIMQAISKQSDLMVAQLVPGMEKFQQSGEGLLQTLTRVASEVATLDTWYQALGKTTSATADAADALVQALGGVDKANQLMGSFVQAFAPAATQGELALKQLTDAGLGQAQFLLTTEDWWKFAQTASTEQTVALLENQGAIQAWVNSLSAANKAVADNIKLQQDKGVADFNAAQSAVNNLRAFGASVRDLQKSLWAGNQSSASATQIYDVTRSQFLDVNSRAAAGDSAAQGQLSASASAFLESSKAQAKSAFDYAKDFALVQNALSDTALTAEVQVSAADKQLTEMQSTNAWLAGLDSKATLGNQSLADLLAAAVGSNGGAAQAIADKDKKAAALTALQSVGAEQFTVDAAALAEATKGKKGVVKAVYQAAELAKQASAWDAAHRAKLAAAQAYYDSLPTGANTSKRPADSGTLVTQPSAGSVWDHTLNIHAYDSPPSARASLPSLAVGTNYLPRDMVIQAHAGERILPAADNSALMQRLAQPVAANDNGELVREIRLLRDEVSKLKAAGEQTATNTLKQEQMLRRFTSDGAALNVRVAA